MDCTSLIKHTDEWSAVVNMIRNIWVP